MLVRILLAAEAGTRRRLQRLLRSPSVLIVAATDRDHHERLAHADFDLLVAEPSALGDPPTQAIAEIRNLPERPETIVVSATDDAEQRAMLLAAGCLAVLPLDIADRVLSETLEALIDRLREEAVGRLRAPAQNEQPRLDDFVSASPAMRRFVAVARRVVGVDSSVLILGETGVGKERLARAIHTDGPRAAGPFIALNCGALPETLMESELFGHERGAFTGASRARRGYFELAHRGTIFLDEIGDVPPHLQVKLLRVLEDHRIQRLGGERAVKIDVRVIAATNRDLEVDVRARRFRQDLYYRLAVVTLALPALRERREDIPDLVRSYLGHFSARLGRRVTDVQPEALDALMRYPWPGNVRELINAVEQVVLLSPGPEVGLADLPRRIVETVPPVAEAVGDCARSASVSVLGEEMLAKPLRLAKREVVSAFERSYLEGQLRRTGGRVGQTARCAGIDPRSLYALMRRHGLRKEDFRGTAG